MLQILIFGQLTEVVGNSSIEVEHTSKVKELKIILLNKFPSLSNKTFAIAVNNKVANEDTVISDGSSIALLPPFSGG